MSKKLKNGCVVSDPVGDTILAVGSIDRWKYLTPDEAFIACHGDWELVALVDAELDKILEERQTKREIKLTEVKGRLCWPKKKSLSGT